jgi:hypothetical protein
MHNQRVIPVTIDGELGPLYDRTFDTQQPLKYACTTHAVLRPVELTSTSQNPSQSNGVRHTTASA